jgi:hypothetical protein
MEQIGDRSDILIEKIEILENKQVSANRQHTNQQVAPLLGRFRCVLDPLAGEIVDDDRKEEN